MIRLLRGLLSRPPVIDGDSTVSRLDRRDDGWGWGGLTPGAKAWLRDRGYSENTIRLIDANQREANRAR